VWWIDSVAGLLCMHRPGEGTVHQWSPGAEVAALSIRTDGRVLVGSGCTLAWFDATTGSSEPWCRLSDVDSGQVRLNDMAWLPDGSLLAASMHRAGHAPLGALHQVMADGHNRVIVGGLTIANGPAVDVAGGAVYWADSPRRMVFRAPLDALDSPQSFIEITPRHGFPDGMAVDHDGHLWIAHYDGARLTQWDRQGRPRRTLHAPVERPTAIAVMPRRGVDGLRLAVTSARDARGAGGQTFLVDVAADGAPVRA
jgi:D-xylonolactonase